MGFRDLTSGVNGVVMQGIKCKFGQNDMVNATKGLSHEGDPFSARCLSPTGTHLVRVRARVRVWARVRVRVRLLALNQP